MSKQIDILPGIENITTDCPIFRNALHRWSAGYADDAVIIQKFFHKYPTNSDLQIIRKKVEILDTRYKTKLIAQGAYKKIDLIQIISKAIYNNNFDIRVMAADETLVDDLRRTVMDMGGNDCLSFMTKYCSFHNPSGYPIYDSWVAKLLKIMNKQYQFTANPEIRKCKPYDKNFSFTSWRSIITDFQRRFAPDLTLLELDRFLFGFAKLHI